MDKDKDKRELKKMIEIAEETIKERERGGYWSREGDLIDRV